MLNIKFLNNYKRSLYILFVIIIFSCNQEQKNPLPIYNPADFNPKLVDKNLRNTSENHTVANFNLINQNGESITQENYNDKIYITDFFFTRCQTFCPIMTDNMVKIQKEFLNDDEIMFLSLSVTPDIDSIPILRDYANKKGVIDTKWNVTTGNKKHIYELARKSYFAVFEKGDGGLQDFIHSPNFILVDKKKQIRGIYNGMNDEDIKQIIKDIKTLKTSL